MTFAHLDPALHSTLTLPLEERIEAIRTFRWIGYPRAQQALQTLDDVLVHPRSLRMRNVLLVGDTGNGKSTIIDELRNRHPVLVQPGGEPIAPIVAMDMPSEPSETRFWTALLLALKIAHRDTDPVQRKQNQAHSTLTYVQCRMLVIDEFHNVLTGHARQQRHFLAVLKNLSNALKLPIVAVGTRASIRALHTDPQLTSRFEAFGMPRWKLDTDYRRLLASFERLLPLAEPSNLANTREVAIKIHAMSEGTIGNTAKILQLAAVHAARRRTERIDTKVLDAIEWVKLADYGKQADAL